MHYTDISIPLSFNHSGPICYYADAPEMETIEMGDFIGDVARGGPVNHRRLHLTPHGNGTHTECYGHISADPEATLRNCINGFEFSAQLITIAPLPVGPDFMITWPQIRPLLVAGVQAVVIRTRPNDDGRLTRNYSGTNPPYFEAALAINLAQRGVMHFVTDLPSVDREQDGGLLAFHKAFFNIQKPRRAATISELAYVPDELVDGLYQLMMMVPLWDTDAAPSRLLLGPPKMGLTPSIH